MRAVSGEEDCMIMTNAGITIRISLKQVSVYGRNSMGVRVINVRDEQKVSTVAILQPEADDSVELTQLPEAVEEPEEETEE